MYIHMVVIEVRELDALHFMKQLLFLGACLYIDFSVWSLKVQIHQSFTAQVVCPSIFLLHEFTAIKGTGTSLVIVKDQSSHLVYPNISIK